MDELEPLMQQLVQREARDVQVTRLVRVGRRIVEMLNRGNIRGMYEDISLGRELVAALEPFKDVPKHESPRLYVDCPLGPNREHGFTLSDGQQCEFCMLFKGEAKVKP